MVLFVFCKGFADGYEELRREAFADAVVIQPFVTRLEECSACRIVFGDPEECPSGAERRDGRPGTAGHRNPDPETNSHLPFAISSTASAGKNVCHCC